MGKAWRWAIEAIVQPILEDLGVVGQILLEW